MPGAQTFNGLVRLIRPEGIGYVANIVPNELHELKIKTHDALTEPYACIEAVLFKYTKAASPLIACASSACQNCRLHETQSLLTSAIAGTDPKRNLVFMGSCGGIIVNDARLNGETGADLHFTPLVAGARIPEPYTPPCGVDLAVQYQGIAV